MLKSPTITETMLNSKLPPIHPGEILLEEFMEPLNLSQNALARAIGVSPRRINQIVGKQRSVTADTALRLARFFDVSPQFWMGLQAQYDLEKASDVLEGRLEQEVKTKAEVLV
jgi:addiction module HigA family antidote